VGVAAGLLMSFSAVPASETALPAAKKILLYSGSTGYRHESIEPGVAALRELAQREGFSLEASEDPNVFTADRLKSFHVIILLSTTTKPDDASSEWFVGARREALEGFLRAGKGIVGIHAAADSHYHWPWYAQMIGGLFERHPKGTPRGELTVVDPTHPSTRLLPKTISHVDEWYYYKDFDPRVRVLLTVDPTSIGEKDTNPNPISWVHEFAGGRVFYTGLGHTPEAFREEFVQKHIAGGLHWAAGESK
jgi:hypothetical protein